MRSPIATTESIAGNSMKPSATMTIAEAIELALCDLGCPSPRRGADLQLPGDPDVSARDGQHRT
jgi:hypothetical protein